MKLYYIILAHKNPEQVKRLISKLDEPWTSFLVHIDSMVDISDFRKLEKNPRVKLIENREIGTWGDLGIVMGTINCLKEIKNYNSSDYCILLSGQDYPIRSNDYIYNFFQENGNTSYISTFPIPHPNWHYGGIDRIKFYKFNKSLKRGHFLQIPSIFDKEFYSFKSIGKLNYLIKSDKLKLAKKIFIRRRFPLQLKPYGGGQWWALPMESVQKILVFLEKNSDYSEYHKFTLLPDEIFFHTLLMNFQPAINTAPSITYVNWDRKNGPLPVTFEISDLEELKDASKNHLFARKFDIEVDQEILEKIDLELLN